MENGKMQLCDLCLYQTNAKQVCVVTQDVVWTPDGCSEMSDYTGIGRAKLMKLYHQAFDAGYAEGRDEGAEDLIDAIGWVEGPKD